MEPYAHLPAIQRRIVEFMMNQSQQNEGIHVGAIARHIGGEAHAIRYVSWILSPVGRTLNLVCSEALDRLMDEGHVYTTIDDSHFALST